MDKIGTHQAREEVVRGPDEGDVVVLALVVPVECDHTPVDNDTLLNLFN